MERYLCSPILLHGVVLNKLGTERALFLLRYDCDETATIVNKEVNE
jgi:hypothetical protein